MCGAFSLPAMVLWSDIMRSAAFLLLILVPILAAVLFLTVDGTILAGVIAFYLVPGLISMRARRASFSRIGTFSVLIAVPFTIIFDYIATVSGLWFVPETVFPRFLGVIPVEDYLWLVAAVFTILSVSTVPEETRTVGWSARAVTLAGILSGILLAGFFTSLSLFGREIFVFSGRYLYLFLASAVFGLPTFLLWVRSRENIIRYAPVITYFFFLSFIFEAIAVRNRWWDFTGEYLFPPIMIFGRPLPLEELFFVGIVGPVLAILMYKTMLRKKSS